MKFRTRSEIIGLWHVRAIDGQHMEIFVGELASYLRLANAVVNIDLIVASPEEDTDSQDSLDFLKPLAESRGIPGGWLRRRLVAADPLMGFSVDLSDERQRAAFSSLAHRVIHAEAWIGDRQVFGWIENPTSLYLDIEEADIHAIVESANAEGAGVSCAYDLL